jgi:hypothetical protein
MKRLQKAFGHVWMVAMSMFIAATMHIVACDSGNSTTDGDLDGDQDEHGEFTITVHYKDQETAVVVGELETATIQGQEAVSLLAVVEEADLGVDVTTLYFDFEAEDGYRPSSRDNCAGIIPATSEQLAYAYVALESHDMAWDESVDYPGLTR